MATESALAFIRSLSGKRELPPVILVSGPQVFLREYILDSVHGLLAARGFQYVSFQANAKDDFSRVVSEIGAGELFAPRRILACRVLRSRRGEREQPDEGESAQGNGKSSREASGEAALAAAIEAQRVPPHLLMLYERDNAPARIRRAVERCGLVVNCLRPFDDQIGQYARVFARRLGMPLPAQTEDLLVSRYGSDLAAIANALDKATINPESAHKLSAEDSSAPAPRAPELFDLAQRLTAGRAPEALRVLDRALGSGRDPLELLGVEIVPVIRRMMIAADLIARRSTSAQVGAALGMPPQGRLVSEAIEGARHYGFPRLEKAHQQLSQLDAGIKSGKIKEGDAALYAILLELLAPASSAEA